MNQSNTSGNYGKIPVKSDDFIYEKQNRFFVSVKAMGKIEQIRTKRERHHIMKR